MSARDLFARGDLLGAAKREAEAADRDGYDITAEILRTLAAALREAQAALAQACTNLATIRPLDMLEPGEQDVSIGDAAERWESLVREQARRTLAVSPPADEGDHGPGTTSYPDSARAEGRAPADEAKR